MCLVSGVQGRAGWLLRVRSQEFAGMILCSPICSDFLYQSCIPTILQRITSSSNSRVFIKYRGAIYHRVVEHVSTM